MFDYTKEAVKKTWEDFLNFFKIFNIVTQAISITYLIFALCTSLGNVWVNAALLLVSVAYLVFFLVMSAKEKSKEQKQIDAVGKKIFHFSKKIIKLFQLGVTVYGVYAASQNVNFLALVQVAFMLVGWVLGVVFDVITLIVGKYKNLIVEGWEADVENMTKPVKTVGNFFKKITGKEIEPEKEPSKQRVWLDQKVAEAKAEKQAQKQAEQEVAASESESKSESKSETADKQKTEKKNPFKRWRK